MANFSRKTYGEGVTKGVDLVVSVYDNAHWTREGRSGVFVQETIHPDSPRAAGQQFLGLKSIPQGEGRTNKNENRTPNQFDAMVAAAGDNVSDLKDQAGRVVGKNYGIKADVMFAGGGKDKDGKPTPRYALANSKTYGPSELSVAEVDGRTINDRIFASQEEAKAARAAADVAKAVETPEVTNEVEASVKEQAEAGNDEPQFG